MQKKYLIDGEIYSQKMIKRALIDFFQVSEMNFSENQLEITGDSESEIDEIFNECMNYCISLISEQ
jgi:hypothetical protein